MDNSGVGQPKNCCIACGLRYRQDMPRPAATAEYKLDTCDVCKRRAVCTTPDQFGGLKAEWKNHGK